VLGRLDNAHVLLRQYADGGSCFEDLVLNTLQWMQVDSRRSPHLIPPSRSAGAQLPLILNLNPDPDPDPNPDPNPGPNPNPEPNLTLTLTLTLTSATARCSPALPSAGPLSAAVNTLQGMQSYTRELEQHVEFETNGWLIAKQLEVCSCSLSLEHGMAG